MSYLYRHSFENAEQSGEIEAYRESQKENIRCKNAIEKAIADNFDGYYLSDTAVRTALADFGYDRTMWVLAASILNKNDDGRFSHENKEWARSVIPHIFPKKKCENIALILILPCLTALSMRSERNIASSDLWEKSRAFTPISRRTTKESC